MFKKSLRPQISIRILFVFLGMTVAFYVVAQVFIPFGFRSGATATLTISDGPTYSFGTVATSTPTDKSFAVTNTGSAAASNVSAAAFSNAAYTFKGGSYPGTGGTCSTQISPSGSCTIVVTANSASIGTIADTITINFRSPAVNATATRAITATFANTATQLAWSSPPNFIRVNECIPLTLQRQDSAGNPVITGGVTTISNLLFNNGVTGTYFSDSGCTATITASTIAAGANSVVVYFRNTTSAQTGILVATATGLVGASRNVTITTNPTRLFNNPSPTIKTSTCTIVPISTVDNNFFPSNATGNVTVNLTTSGSNTFFSDSGCLSSITSTTILAGTNTVNVYTSNATVESATLTATDAAALLSASNKSVNFNSSLTWWNSSWINRIRIDINNADQAAAFTNQPVLVRLNSNRIDYSSIKANGADIRFIASDDTTVLDHEIDYWNASGNSDVWVEIPNIASSSTTGYFYMYYNNPGAIDGQNRNGVWSNFWSVWHLGDNPSGTAPQYVDSTGSGRNGTATNSPLRGSGVIGQASDFTSSATDYIAVATNLTALSTGDFTFSAWMRTTATGVANPWSSPGLTGIEVGGGSTDIFVGWIDNTGLIGITAGNTPHAKSNFIVNNNAWRHVSMTRNYTTGAAVFYINGIANGSATTTVPASITAFNRLGAVVNGVNYSGFLDEVRIYNSVRNADQILADFKYMADTHLLYGSVELGP